MSSPLTVLVINDDGPETPLLIPFLSELQGLSWAGEIRVVIPDSNRSWIGAAITYSDPIRVKREKLGDWQAYLLSGTPADCASIGIFNLFDTPPDLVLSGINIGRNTGLPFTTNSGTLGGAILASMSGVSAIALSAKVPPEIKKLVERDFGSPQIEKFRNDWLRISKQAARLADLALEQSLHNHSRVININMPWEVEDSTPIELTRIRNGSYGRLFKIQPDGSYRHDEYQLSFDPDGDPAYTDEQCMVDGKVSVTLMDLLLKGNVLPHDKAREIERNFHTKKRS